jgi:predicted AlkP superfamily phosphohydrolase/phosphomutase/tetratricopeptide (TPR) repeat protein
MAQDPSTCVKRLLLVGWDAADWKVIDPLLAAGDMPHLSRLIGEGVRGNHATIYPALSPMLWTSIATGKRPGKHGIHGFTEPTEDGLSVRPVSNLGRKTKAFWNILNQQGKRSIVVGWWPSHPAEPIVGAMVSNHFPFHTSQGLQMPLLPGTVWPPDESEPLAAMRVHPTEISSDILRLFAPQWSRVNQSKDKSIHDLAAMIAETMSIHAAATDLMERTEWDLAAVYYAGIDHFSHRFMRFHAGKARLRKGPSLPESDPEWFRGIVVNAYRYHDVMLGRLLTLAGPDCAVIVASDHGFHSDALLPDYIPAEAAGPAVEHRHFGIFCMRAPGVKRGERIYGASILDVAPTVLHLFGLPVGADMDGQVLVNAFEQPQLLETVPSWDAVPGDDGQHPPSRRYDGAAAAESLKQLVDLGYVAPPGDDARRTVAECVIENRYNLARSYMDEGRPDLAIGILRSLIEEDPEDGRFYQHLFYCYMQAGDRKGAERALETFDRACAESAPRAAEELNRRRESRKDEDLAGEPGAPNRRELYERRKLLEKAGGYSVSRLLLHVRLALAKATTPARKETARAMLEELATATRNDLSIALFLAEGFGVVGDPERALRYTRRVLRADPENAPALALEARLHQAAARHHQAVKCAVDSLALVYFQPLLHCLLGHSLARLHEWERAEDAFRVALAQAPGLPQAHEGLGRLLRRDRARLGEAALHLAHGESGRTQRKRARMKAGPEPETAPGLPGIEGGELSPPADRSRVIVVVSGLPRTGTSMMMQMLVAGGIAAYTDDHRRPDADNPRGYMEHEKATQLHRDQSWLPEARGRAVKVVAHLLPYLSDGEEYRVIFMHRALDEVVASQSAMLARLGRQGGGLSEREMARVFAGQLVRVQEWLKRAPNVQVLAMQYAQVLDDPAAAAGKLAAFLGEPFDQAKAAASVAPELRRQGR